MVYSKCRNFLMNDLAAAIIGFKRPRRPGIADNQQLFGGCQRSIVSNRIRPYTFCWGIHIIVSPWMLVHLWVWQQVSHYGLRVLSGKQTCTPALASLGSRYEQLFFGLRSRLSMEASGPFSSYRLGNVARMCKLSRIKKARHGESCKGQRNPGCWKEWMLHEINCFFLLAAGPFQSSECSTSIFSQPNLTLYLAYRSP